MKIITSWNYYHTMPCEMEHCDPHYCAEHRLLWRDCDTAVRAGNGIGGYTWWDLNDCPHCVRDARLKRFDQYREDHDENLRRSAANRN